MSSLSNRVRRLEVAAQERDVEIPRVIGFVIRTTEQRERMRVQVAPADARCHTRGMTYGLKTPADVRVCCQLGRKS